MTAPATAAPTGVGMAGAGAPAIGKTPQSLTQRLFEARGPTYPALGPESSDQLKVTYVEGLLNDTEGDAMLRFKESTQALLFSDGRQHIDWTTREKTWRDMVIPQGRLPVTMNYMRPILRSRMQRMVSAELMWRTIPPSNDYEDRDRATVNTNLITNRWEKTDMDAKTRLALWFAFHCGMAAFKSFWNPNIGPMVPATMLMPHPGTGQLAEYPVDRNGQPLHDEQGNPAPLSAETAFKYRPGDTDTALRTIFNLRINPDATGFQPDEGLRWILDSEVVPISVVKERYGDRAKQVASLAGATSGRNYMRLVRSLTGTLGLTVPGDGTGARGVQAAEKDSTLLTEYWEEPTELLPKGRLIVTAGSQLLYPLEGDEEGEPQGFTPFVAVYDEKRPFDPWGRGCAKDLIAPQKVVNRQWQAELETQMRDGIGQWIMWGIPGLSDQITNSEGAHIQIPTTSALSNRPIGDIVQRVPPSGFNTSRWKLIEEAKATMFDIGAFHEIQRGQVPPGVDSGVAVQYLQEAENAQLHDPVRNLKASLKMWSRHQGKIADWGYGENEVRWIPVRRPDLGYLVEAVRGIDLPDPDEVDVDLEGFRPTSQAAMRAEITDFMEKGFIPARQGLLLMDLGRGIEGVFESQTRHYARARRENLALERGQIIQVPIAEDPALANIPTAGLGYALMYADKTPVLLPADDEHAVHIPIHQDIALNDTIPWPVRQMTLLHIAEHRTMAAMQLQQMVPPPTDGTKPGAGGGAAPETGQ